MNWIDDDENGIIISGQYFISQWTGEAWGPNGFYVDLSDIDEAKKLCELHLLGQANEGGEG